MNKTYLKDKLFENIQNIRTEPMPLWRKQYWIKENVKQSFLRDMYRYGRTKIRGRKSLPSENINSHETTCVHSTYVVRYNRENNTT